MLFAASGVFSAMRTILNTVFQLRPQGLPLAGKVKDVALLFLVLWLLLLAVILSPAMEAIQASPWVAALLGRPLVSPLQDLIYEGGALVLVWSAFFGLYRFLPQGKVGKRPAAFGALWAAGLWKVAEIAFGYYLSHFANLTRLYGAYALGAAALLWIYYSAIVFVLAAQIGQLHRERRALRSA